MTNKLYKNIPFCIVQIFLFCACFFYTLFEVESAYSSLPLLILCFCLCFKAILIPAYKKNNSIVLFAYISISCARYVVAPILVIYTGNYSASQFSIKSDSYNQAVILMCIELLVCSTFFLRISYQYQTNVMNIIRHKKIEYPLNNIGILLAIFLSLGIALCFKGSFGQINFVIPRVSRIQADTAPTGVKLSVYLLGASKQFLYLFLVVKCAKNYERWGHMRCFLLAVILSLINISLYFGSSRTSIVMPAISSLILMVSLFHRWEKSIFFVLGCLLCLITVYVSFSRNVLMDVFSGKSNFFDSLSAMFDAYLGGPYNVSVALKTSALYSRQYATIDSFIAEFLRYVLGISLMYKNSTVVSTAELFNIVFSNGFSDVGQIIPIIGQGFFYLGWIGAALFDVIFLYVAVRLEKLLKNTGNPYILYFICQYCIRIGIIGGQNTQLLMSSLIANVLIPLIVIKVNGILALHKRCKVLDSNL